MEEAPEQKKLSEKEVEEEEVEEEEEEELVTENEEEADNNDDDEEDMENFIKNMTEEEYAEFERDVNEEVKKKELKKVEKEMGKSKTLSPPRKEEQQQKKQKFERPPEDPEDGYVPPKERIRIDETKNETFVIPSYEGSVPENIFKNPIDSEIPPTKAERERRKKEEDKIKLKEEKERIKREQEFAKMQMKAELEKQKQEQAFQNMLKRQISKGSEVAYNKFTEEDKKRKEWPQVKDLLNRMQRYYDFYPQLRHVRGITAKSSIAEIQEALDSIQDQLNAEAQMKIAQASFCGGFQFIELANRLAGSPLELTQPINLTQSVTANYKMFEPTWQEIVIKYNLFKVGPEMRLLALISNFVMTIDKKNKEKSINTDNIPQQQTNSNDYELPQEFVDKYQSI